jgi:DNA-binding transcriptional ArsR family regulator
MTRASNAGRTEDELVFKALADSTRRDLLDVLRRGPRTTGELCARHPEMSRFGVMDHIRVLVEAGLILVERAGRERLNYLNPVPIQGIHDRWITRFAGMEAVSLLALKVAAEENTR